MVERSDLRWRERARRGSIRDLTKARLRLLAVVESENRGDRIQEVRRNSHGPNTVPEGPAGVRDRRRELGIECGLQIVQAPRRLDEPVLDRSGQVILRCEGDDRRDRGRSGRNDRDSRVLSRVHRGSAIVASGCASLSDPGRST